MEDVTIDARQLEVVARFYYLEDTIAAEGSSHASIITKCRVAWGKFRELLPILPGRSSDTPPPHKMHNLCRLCKKRHAVLECMLAHDATRNEHA